MFAEELQEHVERHTHQAVAVYQNLSAGILNKPSSVGGWSIVQCLAHLNSYFSYYLPLLSNAVQTQSTDPPVSVKLGWLGSYFIRMMDADGKPSKYKAAKQHLPAPNLGAHEVVAAFIEHQESMLTILRNVDAMNLNHYRVPTSINRFISLRLGETLAFLVVHNERHIRQANRNISPVTMNH